jgi:hypothetical protein
MQTVTSILYEAYLEAIADGALDVAKVLDKEIEDLANETQLATQGGIG